jgi:hypothetical protein
LRFIARPFQEILSGLERCLVRGVTGLVLCFTGLLVSWWVYVPLHELLHAFGCELGGGRVWRLEIDPLYGGALLARWLDFVVAGGDYAGRLAGFDTGGSDAVHLLTTGLPFLITTLPGVWLLRWGARRASGLAFGAGLVPAMGPFLSLTGDVYEVGSLLVVQLPPWSSAPARLILVGDDVAVVIGRLGPAASLWLAFFLAWAIGVTLAFLLYAAASGVATRLGQPGLEPLPRRRRSGGTEAPAPVSGGDRQAES